MNPTGEEREEADPHVEVDAAEPTHVVLPPAHTWPVLDPNNPPAGWTREEVEWIIRGHELGGES